MSLSNSLSVIFLKIIFFKSKKYLKKKIKKKFNKKKIIIKFQFKKLFINS